MHLWQGGFPFEPKQCVGGTVAACQIRESQTLHDSDNGTDVMGDHYQGESRTTSWSTWLYASLYFIRLPHPMNEEAGEQSESGKRTRRERFMVICAEISVSRYREPTADDS